MWNINLFFCLKETVEYAIRTDFVSHNPNSDWFQALLVPSQDVRNPAAVLLQRQKVSEWPPVDGGDTGIYEGSQQIGAVTVNHNGQLSIMGTTTCWVGLRGR